MSNNEVVVFPAKCKNSEDEEEVRGLRAGAFLWTLLEAAKAQLDPATWFAKGGAEAEAVLVAWDDGGRHPFFTIWEQRKGSEAANRPAPAPYEVLARRHVIRMVKALQDAGFKKPGAARKFAAQELTKAKVFQRPTTAKMIENWQGRQPELEPEDKLVIAQALTAHGLGNFKAIARHFIGLCELARNPAPVVLKG
jgi:hypothetical protein